MSLGYNLMNSTKLSHKDLDAYIGRKLKFRRTMLGISQDKLGSYLGITFQQIQKYEKGTNRVSASMLCSISKMLKVDIGYFVEGFESSDALRDDNKATYDATAKMKESKEIANLLKSYDKISTPAVKKKIADLVKVIALENEEDS